MQFWLPMLKAVPFHLFIRAASPHHFCLHFIGLHRTQNSLLKKEKLTHQVAIFTYLHQNLLVVNRWKQYRYWYITMEICIAT